MYKETLQINLLSCVEAHVQNFLRFASENGCDRQKLMQAYNAFKGVGSAEVVQEVVEEVVQQEPSNTCVHVFTRGERVNQQCGAKVKNGTDTCTKHTKNRGMNKKKEDTHKKEKKEKEEDMNKKKEDTHKEEKKKELLNFEEDLEQVSDE
jgi:hypothetical protein